MAIKICKACKDEFDTRYQDLYCKACKGLKKPIVGSGCYIREKVYINCKECNFRFLGWPQTKYCSNKCKPVYLPSHRQRSVTKLKNTLLDDCIHFFPRSADTFPHSNHECTEETMIFTCRECKGVLEFFKDPYDIEKPEQSCPGSIIVR